MEKINKIHSLDECPTAEVLQAVTKERRRRKDFRKMILNTAGSLLVVCAAAVLIATLIMPVLKVTGSSMEPTFKNDDIVICAKNADIKKGDVIAFYFNNKILMKRVIAVGGEEVEVKSNGSVLVEGKEIDEPYISKKAYGECDIEMPYRVPEKRYFVMGDNREASIDSRSTMIGCVSSEAVLGKVLFKI